MTKVLRPWLNSEIKDRIMPAINTVILYLWQYSVVYERGWVMEGHWECGIGICPPLLLSTPQNKKYIYILWFLRTFDPFTSGLKTFSSFIKTGTEYNFDLCAHSFCSLINLNSLILWETPFASLLKAHAFPFSFPFPFFLSVSPSFLLSLSSSLSPYPLPSRAHLERWFCHLLEFEI